jgi:hypothetical protein
MASVYIPEEIERMLDTPNDINVFQAHITSNGYTLEINS